ncbi:hypothetical protein N7527_011742 [Penicillium freii]|nr:hypothetical protein N7527_011742 [Penicillium freii]
MFRNDIRNVVIVAYGRHHRGKILGEPQQAFAVVNALVYVRNIISKMTQEQREQLGICLLPHDMQQSINSLVDDKEL